MRLPDLADQVWPAAPLLISHVLIVKRPVCHTDRQVFLLGKFNDGLNMRKFA